MSNDTHLYGVPRPKNKPIPLSSSSIHSLSTELASLTRSLPTSTSTSGRLRPSKTSALFKSNKGVSSRARKDLQTTSEDLGGNASANELEQSKRKLKEKAELYDKLKRGEVDSVGEVLVDFDQKWAEYGEQDDAREEEDDDDGELVEYEDEFGRTRKGTKAEAKAADNAKNVQKESNHPKQPPANVIYGDIIQTHAFQTPQFSTVPTTDKLAAALPTEEEDEAQLEAHYDASKEVRTKGVGFYQFSTDAKKRKEEMQELEAERIRTENERKEKEERRKRKREEIEKRKEMVRSKRRVKVGESWLEQQFGGAVE